MSHLGSMSAHAPGGDFTRWASFMVFIITTGFLFYVLGPLLQPFFLAIFLFYITIPIMNFLSRRGIPTWIGQALMVVLMVGLTGLLSWGFSSYADEIAEKLPPFQEKARSLVSESIFPFVRDIPFIGASLGRLVRKVDLTRLPDSVVRPFVGRVFEVVSGGVLAIFYYIFIVHEAKALPQRVQKTFSPPTAERILSIGYQINSGVTNYLYVKFLMSLISAVFSFVVLVLFGIEFAPLWAGIIFLANFIPYIGSIASISFPIAMGFLQWQGLTGLLLMAALLIGFDVILGNLIEPAMAGSKLNVHPILVLFWLSLWGWLWGIMGLLLAVPLLVVVKSVLDSVPRMNKAGSFISSEVEDAGKGKSDHEFNKSTASVSVRYEH